jgi:nucleoside-diphosphate-sugar epimerase
MILITGSSGYVGSDLIPRLKSITQVCGIDIIPSEHTNVLAGIETAEFKMALEELACDEVNVVNLAAARFDFGANADDYFNLNVRCHELFLNSLNNSNVKNFVHVSSVASFDGRDIPYSKALGCDDAYRSTKYLQEVLVKEWCEKNSVNLTILYPSAIFSEDARSDTNIGKMQTLSRYLPFVPLIDVHKSLTYLPQFSTFIIDVIGEQLPSGQYLTIEQPTLAVSEMIRILSGRSLRVMRVPGLRCALRMAATVLFFVGGFGKIDLKLTPNRVSKLFSDTAYNELNDGQVDQNLYISRYDEGLIDILKNFKNK